jgi:tRNA(Arg) A34 adenosine deaminase TadA
MRLPDIKFQLPRWIPDFLEKSGTFFPTGEDRMRFAVALSRQNVKNRTGGPFGAAIFDDSGHLTAPGVNLVTTANCSVLHAEITAIILTQSILGRYDIGDGGRLNFSLYAATEPCVMCFGAVHWSGVRRLVCGARSEDAGAIGFDEGPKPQNWVSALEKHGVEVTRDVLREEAASVLRDYAASGGLIYNPGHPG